MNLLGDISTPEIVLKFSCKKIVIKNLDINKSLYCIRGIGGVVVAFTAYQLRDLGSIPGRNST